MVAAVRPYSIQVEFRHRQRCKVRQHYLNTLGTATLGSMKFVHTKLSDCQRMKHSTFAAVIAPNQKIEIGEVVDLFAYALEIMQGQSSNHYVALIFVDWGIVNASFLIFEKWYS